MGKNLIPYPDNSFAEFLLRCGSVEIIIDILSCRLLCSNAFEIFCVSGHNILRNFSQKLDVDDFLAVFFDDLIDVVNNDIPCFIGAKELKHCFRDLGVISGGL